MRIWKSHPLISLINGLAYTFIVYILCVIVSIIILYIHPELIYVPYDTLIFYLGAPPYSHEEITEFSNCFRNALRKLIDETPNWLQYTVGDVMAREEEFKSGHHDILNNLIMRRRRIVDYTYTIAVRDMHNRVDYGHTLGGLLND
jgi:hypothetical protein